MDTATFKSGFVNVNGIRLHYLDWGGEGPVLLFLAGMTCSAYIFKSFAPRFADKFHVLALDRRGHGDSDYPETGYDPDTLTEDLRQFLDALKIDQVILVGHSMARVELSRFAVLYPERLLKLVFLDAAYDSSSLEYKAVMEKNPLTKIMPASPKDSPKNFEEFVTILKRLYPALAMIWGEAMEEQTRHTVKTTPDGKVIDRMSDTISKAIKDTLASYQPEYSKIQAPVLSFFAMRDGSDFLSLDYMTEEQQVQLMDYSRTVLEPYRKKYVEQFQHNVPHANVVEIPNGHHYCFIKQEEIVFDEMRKFLLPA
jgi:non-heme chloroperoxidase